jgi:hypothetical protein
MTEKIGRNQHCPCDSGKKYKKCCMNDIDSGKKVFRTITRDDFISGPYRDCSKCGGAKTQGVFMPISGSRSYSRECKICRHEISVDLPAIQKKVVYLDQFLISNLIKFLDKEHPSHAKVAKDPFWAELFEKLERASKAQAIVCPDSFYHRDESIAGRMDFSLMRRLYEHFSHGKTLYPSATVERFQILEHFDGWLRGEKVVFGFDPQHIAFDSNLHTWDIGLHVSVGGSIRPDELSNLQDINGNTQQQLLDIWECWKKEGHVSFEQHARDEMLGFGKGHLTAMRDFAQRNILAMNKIAQDPSLQPDLNDILPPMSSDLLGELIRISRVSGVSEEEVPNTIGRYLGDIDALFEVPALKISSILFAGLARKAAMGEKQPPNSTADVQFISSYMPYADAMFVDKQCYTLLKELPSNTPEYLRLNEFDTKIFSLNQKKDFLDYLDEIVDTLEESHIELLQDINGEEYNEPYWSIIEHEKGKRGREE